VVLSPVLAHAPPVIGHLGPELDAHAHLIRVLRYAAFTPLQNVSGSPAISLPLGRSASGVPVGVQVAAPFGHERRLLELAFELEEAAPWPTLSSTAGDGARH
jgi:amidase